MRVVAMFTKARYIVAIAGDPVKRKHTGNARSTGTRKRQSNFVHAPAVVCNLKARYMDAIIRTLANKKHTGNAKHARR